MTALEAYALAKKIAISAVSGIKNLSVDGTTLIIETNDGNILNMDFPVPKDGNGIAKTEINSYDHLIITYDDGTVEDAGLIHNADVEVTQLLKEGIKIAKIKINGVTTDLFAPRGGGGGGDCDYYIIDLIESLPDDLTENDRRIYFCLEDNNFHLWNGIEWEIISCGGNVESITLTQAEYDALTPEEKADTSKIYYVTDAETTAIPLSDNEVSAHKVWSSQKISDELDTKVDKVVGKGLSTNDYTNEEKTKLANIPSGAEANVQSDWEQDDNTADDYIKNKPTIPPGVVVDQTYDASSTNAQSGTAVASAVSGKVDTSSLGTAAYKNVPVSGNASVTQVVMGGDTRLSDSRAASDVYPWAKKVDKPTYTASEVGAIPTTEKGSNNGVATLGSDGKVPSSQLPSYVDDVLEYANMSVFPSTGESGKIYIAQDTNKTYRWSGTAYVEISSSLALGETSSTAYAGNKGKTNADNIATIQGLIPSTATTSNKLATVGDIPSVSSKADKVSNATSGNFAGLDANGNLIDSGKKPSDFLTSHQSLADYYATTDTAETALADNDYVPFYDTSASAKRKTLWSNIKSVLKTYFDNIYLSSIPVASASELGGILYTINTRKSGIDLGADGEMTIRNTLVNGLGNIDSPYTSSGFIPLVNSILLSSGLSLQANTVKIAISSTWVSSNFDTSSKSNLIASMKKYVLLGLRFDTSDIRTVGFCDWKVD